MPPVASGPVFTVSRPILTGLGWAKAGAGIVTVRAVPTKNPRREIVTGIASSSVQRDWSMPAPLDAPEDRTKAPALSIVSRVNRVAGMPLAYRRTVVNEFTPEQEQVIIQVVNRLTRQQAQVLERV